ncbi:MAG: PQQ-binding-like beta-propeller repeat protein [Verrucomicrobiota bacterium]
MKMHLSWFLVALGVPTAFAEDWPHWRGPAFDGISQEALPAELPDELPVLWRAQVGIGFSTVSVTGDRVFTMGNTDEKDTVWCLDAKTGEVIWEHTYDCELDPLYYEGGPSATPTIHNGAVFTLSKKGHAFCLDLESGDVTWSRDLIADYGFELPEWSFASSAFIDGDLVLLNVGREGLALDKTTGKTVWKSSTETAGYATVVPFAKSERLLFSADSLLSLDGQSGKKLWEYPWRSNRDVNAADPVVNDRRILISSNAGGMMIEVNPETREVEEVWENKNLKWHFNAGVMVGGHIYSINGTTHRPTELTCTDAKTGETLWAEEGFGNGALMAADSGKTLILFDKGELTIFETTPDGFSPRLRQQILQGKCWTVPVFANGQIYCRSAEGELVAVGVEK